jgi:hypothetical protein
VTEPHVHFVLTDPYGDPPRVLLVNMTSECYDRSVVLVVGDHPEVRHDSYIWFAQATRAPLEHLLEAFDQGLATVCDRASVMLMTILREGFMRSEEVPRDMKKELVEAVRAEGRSPS